MVCIIFNLRIFKLHIMHSFRENSRKKKRAKVFRTLVKNAREKNQKLSYKNTAKFWVFLSLFLLTKRKISSKKIMYLCSIIFTKRKQLSGRQKIDLTKIKFYKNKK